MSQISFDPFEFYSSYPSKIILRPGYPARAAYKSTFMFNLFGRQILHEIGTIKTYADIGGCFGFGANSMAYQIHKHQGNDPRTIVFEISSDFIHIGRMLFPHIEFIESEFRNCDTDIHCFDLITLFDVVEHILDPKSFLQQVSVRSRFVMLKTPLETSGEWRGDAPPINQGNNHEDGHINFFDPIAYETLLKASGLDIVTSRIVQNILPRGTSAILTPEVYINSTYKDLIKKPKKLLSFILRGFPGIPWHLKRKIFGGGDHVCLCRSRISELH